MASTTVTVGCGSAISDATAKGGRASVIVNAGAAVFGISTIQEVGNNSARSQRWLPTTRQPIAYIQGPDGKRMPVYVDEQWYRFFDELATRRLGGVTGPTITDVATNASAAVSAVNDSAASAAAAQQAADASILAVAQTKSVLVKADILGAEFIEVPYY